MTLSEKYVAHDGRPAYRCSLREQQIEVFLDPTAMSIYKQELGWAGDETEFEQRVVRAVVRWKIDIKKDSEVRTIDLAHAEYLQFLLTHLRHAWMK